MTSQIWRQRIQQEKSDLDKKIDALSAFLPSGEFSALDTTSQNLLTDQWLTMKIYSDILKRRLSFGVALGQKPRYPVITGHEFDEVKIVGVVPDDDPPFFLSGPATGLT